MFKEEIKNYLKDNNIEYMDFGCFSEDQVDYPVVAEVVAKAVASGQYEKGLLFCGTGVGMCISANKVKGIRAVVCSEPYSAKLSRQHNDTNILALGSREELLVQPVIRFVKEHAYSLAARKVKIEKAMLGEDAPMIGAATLYKDL